MRQVLANRQFQVNKRSLFNKKNSLTADCQLFPDDGNSSPV